MSKERMLTMRVSDELIARVEEAADNRSDFIRSAIEEKLERTDSEGRGVTTRQIQDEHTQAENEFLRSAGGYPDLPEDKDFAVQAGPHVFAVRHFKTDLVMLKDSDGVRFAFDDYWHLTCTSLNAYKKVFRAKLYYTHDERPGPQAVVAHFLASLDDATLMNIAEELMQSDRGSSDKRPQ